ncbi:MAG: glycosyl hydrolase family 18 protein [Chloroflexota bacterium]
MTSRSTSAPGRVRHALAVSLAALVLAGLPAIASAGDPAQPARVPDLRPYRVQPGDEPSQMYLDTAANEHRSFRFTPGDRVTVGFRPRADDRWPVGGHAPRALPAGRESGAEMAESPSAPVEPPPVPDATPGPAPTPLPPDTMPDATPIPAEGAMLVVPSGSPGLAPAAVGMRREVYGFLPYWEVADSDTVLNFDILTHLAYFSVGSDAKGNLKKRESNGSLTTGWAGWTSAKMTSIINAAHAKRSRVTLTLSVFAWTSGQVTVQKTLLGSSAARLNLARQAVAAVRDRGADGINLDFEPLVSGYEDEFVSLVRTIRAELDRIAPGYHLSFDTLGYPGNYPLEGALAAGGADAVFVMGYDYRTASANYAGSIDPLAGPAYDLTDTVRAYTARVPASRVILGIPYYGRAWSTVSDTVNARTQTGAKYGYSSAVNYTIAAAYAAEYGRRYDSREVSAWTAYRKQNCTATYGCVTTWRQIYYDDAATLKARYDLVNRSGLRGAGIWALGYDGTRPELYRALADKFLNDTTPPVAGLVAFPATGQPDEGFVVRWTAADDFSGIASYDVQVSVDGGPWAGWLTGTKAASGTYLGSDSHGYAFRVRARDGKGNVSAWDVTSVYAKTPTLAPGGFLRVTADILNVRSAPGTSATRITTASRGDLFAITGGPATADGYTWYEVSGPLTTWGPVGDVERSVWVAASGSGATNAAAARAPNATLLQAGIRLVSFSGNGAASLGTSAAAAADRSFSPNGDGSEDRLVIRWNNRRALDSLTLRVVRPDGTLVGTRALGDTSAGTQEYAWDGTVGVSVADGPYVLQLVGVDGATTYTWPADSPTATGLAALVGVTVDRVPPTLGTATASGSRLSPNGDGRYDAMTISGTGSADVARWDVIVAPVVGGVVGDPIRRIAGSGRSARTSWNGMTDAGTRAPDGTYRVTLRFFDAAGNSATRSWPAIVDATPPRLTATARPAALSPNADGVADTTRLAWTSSERATGTLRVLRGTKVIRSWTISGTAGAVTWNGRDAAGRTVADGRYTVAVTGSDALANRARVAIFLFVDRTVGRLRWDRAAFFPQDADRLAPTATVSVKVARSARLTLRVLDASGAVVRTAWTNRAFAAGTAAWRWDGRTAAGTWAKPGRYVAELTAVSWLGTTVLRRTVVADAFTTSLSSAAPRAGSRLSVTFRSVEPLAATPTASLRQAGRSAVRMTVVRLADGFWRATATVAAGAPGPAAVTLVGRDTAGGRNITRLTVTVP